MRRLENLIQGMTNEDRTLGEECRYACARNGVPARACDQLETYRTKTAENALILSSYKFELQEAINKMTALIAAHSVRRSTDIG